MNSPLFSPSSPLSPSLPHFLPLRPSPSPLFPPPSFPPPLPLTHVYLFPSLSFSSLPLIFPPQSISFNLSFISSSSYPPLQANPPLPSYPSFALPPILPSIHIIDIPIT